jgi:hypothetical protein
MKSIIPYVCTIGKLFFFSYPLSHLSNQRKIFSFLMAKLIHNDRVDDNSELGRDIWEGS